MCNFLQLEHFNCLFYTLLKMTLSYVWRRKCSRKTSLFWWLFYSFPESSTLTPKVIIGISQASALRAQNTQVFTVILFKFLSSFHDHKSRMDGNLNSAKMFTSLVINNNYYMKLWDHYPASVRRFLVITEKVGSLESFCCSVRHQADAKKEKKLRKKRFFKEVVWNLFSLNHR